MIITGGATVHGRVGMVSKIKEKSMGGLKAFPDETVNMIIPLANTVGDFICNDCEYTYRNQQGGRSRIQREWFTMDKAEQKRLNVFAAANLYEVLELAIIADQEGKDSSVSFGTWRTPILPLLSMTCFVCLLVMMMADWSVGWLVN